MPDNMVAPTLRVQDKVKGAPVAYWLTGHLPCANIQFSIVHHSAVFNFCHKLTGRNLPLVFAL